MVWKAELEELARREAFARELVQIEFQPVFEPNASTCTLWSMTRSHLTSGLIRFGSPPSFFIASRIAARSTTQGTPVKSCSTTRPGMNGTSSLAGLLAFQFASPATSSCVTMNPSTFRNMLSKSTLIENGSRSTEGKDFARAVDGMAYRLQNLASSDCDWWSSLKGAHRELNTIGNELESAGIRLPRDVSLSELWLAGVRQEAACDLAQPYKEQQK